MLSSNVRRHGFTVSSLDSARFLMHVTVQLDPARPVEVIFVIDIISIKAKPSG